MPSQEVLEAIRRNTIQMKLLMTEEKVRKPRDPTKIKEKPPVIKVKREKKKKKTPKRVKTEKTKRVRKKVVLTEEQRIKNRAYQAIVRERNRQKKGVQKRRTGLTLCEEEGHRKYGTRRDDCRECAIMGHPSLFKKCDDCDGYFKKCHFKTDKHQRKSNPKTLCEYTGKVVLPSHLRCKKHLEGRCNLLNENNCIV